MCVSDLLGAFSLVQGIRRAHVLKRDVDQPTRMGEEGKWHGEKARVRKNCARKLSASVVVLLLLLFFPSPSPLPSFLLCPMTLTQFSMLSSSSSTSPPSGGSRVHFHPFIFLASLFSSSPLSTQLPFLSSLSSSSPLFNAPSLVKVKGDSLLLSNSAHFHVNGQCAGEMGGEGKGLFRAV